MPKQNSIYLAVPTKEHLFSYWLLNERAAHHQLHQNSYSWEDQSQNTFPFLLLIFFYFFVSIALLALSLGLGVVPLGISVGMSHGRARPACWRLVPLVEDILRAAGYQLMAIGRGFLLVNKSVDVIICFFYLRAPLCPVLSLRFSVVPGFEVWWAQGSRCATHYGAYTGVARGYQLIRIQHNYLELEVQLLTLEIS